MSPSKRVAGWLIVVGAVLLALCASATATPLIQSASLTNPAGTATGFGTSVALSSDGSTAVVGAPGDGDGAAYVYTRHNGSWSQTATLTNPAGTATGFGTSVALSSDGATVVVGAPGDASAYVYSSTGGAPTATLTDPAGAGTGFGTSVAIAGSTIVVGAPAGANAYVYSTTSTTPTATLTDPAGTGTGFGTSVALNSDGSTIIVGAPNGGNSYVYPSTGGSPTATLTPTSAAAGFGSSVAISGSSVIVGAPQAGSAYIYPTTGGSPTAILTNAATFGSSVAISGSTIVVGAPSGGSAYVYPTAGGSPTATLTNAATFGASVALAGTTALVGAPTPGDGAAYVYTPPVAISTTVEDSSTGQSWAGTETTGAFARDAATVTGQSGAPTGTVTYALYGSSTCTGTAAQTNSTNVNDGTSDPFGPLHAGAYGFVATYAGDATYGVATGECEPFTVGRAATALAASATPSTLSYGNTVILSAAGLPTAATGTIAFTAAGTTLCAATVSSGAGACTTGVLTPGSYAVTATYSGDGDDQGATASTTFAISPPASTTFILPPSITITAPVNGATYTHDESVRARFRCVDGANAPGISSCDGTVGSGAPIDTSTVGPHGFTVTAESRSGESTIRTLHYTVKLPANRIIAARPSLGADGRGAIRVTVPGPGRLSGVETAWPAGQREPRAGHRALLSSGAVKVRRAGNVTLRLSPGAVGRRLLARSHGRRLRVHLSVTFVPTGGTARQVSASGLVRVR